MPDSLSNLVKRAIDSRFLRADGALTLPRTWGVYELVRPGGTRTFRFGNHPIRMRELEAEFREVRLRYVFRNREDARLACGLLNAGGE